jgi:hypothetical protein
MKLRLIVLLHLLLLNANSQHGTLDLIPNRMNEERIDSRIKLSHLFNRDNIKYEHE